MSFAPHVTDEGALQVTPRLRLAPTEITLRVTTSGGPGGQHANRSLTRVVASFSVATSTQLSDHQRALLLETVGDTVSASSSRFRSQGQNRASALEQLAIKLAQGLHRDAPRRATRPTRASKVRRVDAKKVRSEVKRQRRSPHDD